MSGTSPSPRAEARALPTYCPGGASDWRPGEAANVFNCVVDSARRSGEAWAEVLEEDFFKQ